MLSTLYSPGLNVLTFSLNGKENVQKTKRAFNIEGQDVTVTASETRKKEILFIYHKQMK